MVKKKKKVISYWLIKWYCMDCLKEYTPNLTVVWPGQWHTDLCDNCFRNLGVTQVAIKLAERHENKRRKRGKHTK